MGVVGDESMNNLIHLFKEYDAFLSTLDAASLQLHWTNRDRNGIGPIEVIQRLGTFAIRLKEDIANSGVDLEEIKMFIESEMLNEDGLIDNKKLVEKYLDVFTGILLGSYFNCGQNAFMDLYQEPLRQLA